MFAKKVELFLMDGMANGRWACELSNWSGKAYKIPRTLISDSKDRDDLDSTGIYFLLGKSDSPDGQARIYIGEAENLFDRLKHNYMKLRSQLIESGALSDQGDHLRLEQDYVFSTPSAAAAIVMGRSANGLTEWKTGAGQILKALEQT